MSQPPSVSQVKNLCQSWNTPQYIWLFFSFSPLATAYSPRREDNPCTTCTSKAKGFPSTKELTTRSGQDPWVLTKVIDFNSCACRLYWLLWRQPSHNWRYFLFRANCWNFRYCYASWSSQERLWICDDCKSSGGSKGNRISGGGITELKNFVNSTYMESNKVQTWIWFIFWAQEVKGIYKRKY